MAGFDAMTFTVRAIIEHNDLVSLVAFQHGGHDACALYRRLPDLDLGLIGDHQDPIQFDLLADLGRQLLHANPFARGNAILACADLNDCVHVFTPVRYDK